MILMFSEPRFYYHNDWYWFVYDNILLQFTEDFGQKWQYGTDVFSRKVFELSKTKPINYSLGQYVLDLYIGKLKKIREIENKAA